MCWAADRGLSRSRPHRQRLISPFHAIVLYSFSSLPRLFVILSSPPRFPAGAIASASSSGTLVMSRDGLLLFKWRRRWRRQVILNCKLIQHTHTQKLPDPCVSLFQRRPFVRPRRGRAIHDSKRGRPVQAPEAISKRPAISSRARHLLAPHTKNESVSPLGARVAMSSLSLSFVGAPGDLPRVCLDV